MAEADLRLLLRTIADTKGAEQTSAALRKVQQDAAGTTNQAQRLSAAQTSVGSSFRTSAAGVAAYVGGLGLAATAGAALTSVLGSSLNVQRESERVTRANAAAYGASAQQFERFAATLSQQTGFTSQAILEAALSARTLTANYGLTIQQTQNLIRASADLARIRGIGVAEAFERVQSAIRGEAEASEFLGLTLNDTYIKNNAMNGSLKNTFETMKDGEKAQIRYNELLKQTEQFQGLAAKSADSLDGALNRAGNSANKLQLEFGKLIAPPTIAGLQKIADLLELMATGGVIGKAARDLGIGRNYVRPSDYTLARDERLQARLRAFEPTLTGDAGRKVVTGLLGGGQAIYPSAEALEANRQLQIWRERQTAPQRRLMELNENVPPVATSAEMLKQIAYVDQRDAAVRDLLSAQREEVTLKEQLTQLEKQHGDMAQRRYQIELSSISAQRGALPAQYALQDTERAVQRARLLLDVRGTSLEERRAARSTIREAERNILPGQRLAAFDAESGMIAAGRQAQAFDLSAREAAIGREQALAGQQAVVDAAANRTDAAMSRLEQIVQTALNERAQRPVNVTLQVLGPDGQVTYEELIEAADQAGMPPVIRVSGVRR